MQSSRKAWPRQNFHHKRTIQLVFLLLCTLLSFIGCSKNDDSPEEQIRRFVASGEEAAESRDLGGITSLISEHYADARTRKKRDLIRITAGYFLRNKNIHLLTRIGELTFPEQNKADLQLFVAMAGSPVTDAATLTNIRADLYRFDMKLLHEKGKEWRLVNVEWRQAIKEDFFDPR